MRILVVGGTAFIGPYVLRGLVADGHDVTVFHRGSSEPDLPGEVRHIHGNRADIAGASLRSADLVLDMIPRHEEDAKGVIAAFRGVAGRVVAISSMDVYLAYDVFRGRADDTPPVAMHEDAPLRRTPFPHRDLAPDENHVLWTYDKIPAEQAYLSEPDLPGTVLRLPAVYGPGDWQHRCWEHLQRMVVGRPAILLDERAAGWRWSRGYVENVADAIVAAITDERAAGRVYNVAEPDAPTEREWVESLARAYGWKGEIVVLPAETLPEHLRGNTDANYAQDVVADTARIRAELGYTERVEREEALRRTVEWEVANPPKDVKAPDYDAEDAALERRRSSTESRS